MTRASIHDVVAAFLSKHARSGKRGRPAGRRPRSEPAAGRRRGIETLEELAGRGFTGELVMEDVFVPEENPDTKHTSGELVCKQIDQMTWALLTVKGSISTRPPSSTMRRSRTSTTSSGCNGLSRPE